MKTLFKKLSSRKLWVCIVGILFGLAVALGVSPEEIEPIAGAVQRIIGMVGAIVSCVAYILGEAKIDAAGAMRSQQAEEFMNLCKTLLDRPTYPYAMADPFTCAPDGTETNETKKEAADADA